MRRLVQLLVLAGLIGTLIDLTFIEHYESALQFIPLVCAGLAALVALWWLVTARRSAALAFQMAMAVLVVAGGTGMALHYRGSAEFQLESDPSAGGWVLFRDVMSSTAPPVMAPANLTLLGLMGLASMYRLEASDEDRNDS